MSHCPNCNFQITTNNKECLRCKLLLPNDQGFNKTKAYTNILEWLFSRSGNIPASKETKEELLEVIKFNIDKITWIN